MINRAHPYTYQFVAVALLVFINAPDARADQEAGNVAHVAASPDGRCYAKSIPKHNYDPEESARQEGVTRIFRVATEADELQREYNWFSQQIFLLCHSIEEPIVVRIGPWHRGHEPRPDHLAIGFYRAGEELHTYSTLELTNYVMIDGARALEKLFSSSESHYTIFESGPTLVSRSKQVEHAVFETEWTVEAKIFGGRTLIFDPWTGNLR